MPSAIWGALDGLATAIKAQSSWSSTELFTGLPTPAQQAQFAVHGYVAGEVEDWSQVWGQTPWDDGSGLQGIRDEAFTLKAGIYTRQAGGTFATLKDVIGPLLDGIEAAVRANRTLGGALSGSGMAQTAGLEMSESLADEKTRELHILVRVSCTAVIA